MQAGEGQEVEEEVPEVPTEGDTKKQKGGLLESGSIHNGYNKRKTLHSMN